MYHTLFCDKWKKFKIYGVFVKNRQKRPEKHPIPNFFLWLLSNPSIIPLDAPKKLGFGESLGGCR